jgi:hypothetical protein
VAFLVYERCIIWDNYTSLEHGTEVQGKKEEEFSDVGRKIGVFYLSTTSVAF